jgi:hypothetical protein
MRDESFHCHPHHHSGEHGCCGRDARGDGGDRDRDRWHGRDREGGRDRQDARGPERGGAPGAEFLHLELSSMLRAMAQDLAQDVVGELLRDAIKQRVSERLGHRIDALAEEAAERLTRDFETNLAIESLITDRQTQGRDGAVPTAQPASTPTSATKRRARR